MIKKKPTLKIGTSNIILSGNKSTFPIEFQDKSRLNYYSSLFNSVEINSTFYKVPKISTFEKWSQDVGSDFQFTIKFWKEVTHSKELRFNEIDIDLFLKRVLFLGSKKGCLLLQFPGKITFDYFKNVERVLQIINSSELSNGWQIAIEFRHSSWYLGETCELLDEYNASMVLHDYPKSKNELLNRRSKIVYLRFHGPIGNYRGSYNYEFLKKKTEQIKQWLKTGKDVYVYFNNTAGDAFENARTLQILNTI